LWERYPTLDNVLDRIIKNQLLKKIMVKKFMYKGHQFELVKIENSTDYLIIRDGRQTRRLKEEIAKNAIENVDKLFKD